MTGGHASPEGTARYAARFPALAGAGFYRPAVGLNVASLGMGTYLGNADETTDRGYTEAALAALEGGINWFDTAINYRQMRSERALGVALARFGRREEVGVSTKAGFLTPGAVPDFLRAEDVAGGVHSMAPDFLADQVERSRANLGLDTIDVLYLHNPETQLRFVSRALFEDRLRAAFDRLEELAGCGRIRWYGTATWDGYREPGQLELDRIVQIATAAGGPGHRFRFIQIPFNMAMTEGRPAFEEAARLGIAGVASATLLQGRLLRQAGAAEAIRFTRETPGVSVALVGMSSTAHVAANLGALA
ncbi:MAG TPA: aldo/keto reductase [Bryobacteraceae bacterium]|nr:aldo/keto reductase [Bryobacteraceae bacterium]